MNRAKPARLGVELVLGVSFLVIGAVLIGVLIFGDDRPSSLGDWIVSVLVMLLFLLLGAVFTLIGVEKWQRVGFLNEHGIRLVARVVAIDGTSLKIGHLPVYRLTVEVADAQAPYRADVRKPLHAHEASAIIGKELSVIAHPTDRKTVILDEEQQV